jgi:hypothetical protein
LTNGDLLAYEIFFFDPKPKKVAIPGGSYLPLRLSKIEHYHITRPLMKFSTESALTTDQWKGGRRFVPFRNIASRSGVFIGGQRPAWYVDDVHSDRIRYEETESDFQ